MIEKYVRQTHAPTHNMYRTEVCEVFEVEREGEEDQFNDLGNKYVSIISFTAEVIKIIQKN